MSGEWMVGRKMISDYLGIGADTLDDWRRRHPDLPIVVIHGQPRATREQLDRWVMAHAENRCPVDGAICARACRISSGKETDLQNA